MNRRDSSRKSKTKQTKTQQQQEKERWKADGWVVFHLAGPQSWLLSQSRAGWEVIWFSHRSPQGTQGWEHQVSTEVGAKVEPVSWRMHPKACVNWSQIPSVPISCSPRFASSSGWWTGEVYSLKTDSQRVSLLRAAAQSTTVGWNVNVCLWCIEICQPSAPMGSCLDKAEGWQPGELRVVIRTLNNSVCARLHHCVVNATLCDITVSLSPGPTVQWQD